MATISGRVIFDRDRSLTVSTGDSGIAGIPVVPQNTVTGVRLYGAYGCQWKPFFINVPNGNHPELWKFYGTPGGSGPHWGILVDAQAGSIPVGTNPPIGAVTNPPAGSTNLDSPLPGYAVCNGCRRRYRKSEFFNGPGIYTPIEAILDECAVFPEKI